MYNDIYDIEGQLGLKNRGPRKPEAQTSQQQQGNVPSSDLQQDARNQASSPYANIPQFDNGAQPREESPYANIPEAFQRANEQQGDRAPQSAPPPRPPRRDLGETAPRAPRLENAGRRDTVAIPRGEEKAPTVQMTGTFVSQFGKGNTEEQGLVFKPTGNNDVLYHFSPSQSNQMRASNEGLIRESMQSGTQTTVSLMKGDRDRTMWKVEAANQQQSGQKIGR